MDFNQIAEKWQKVWDEKKIFEANSDPSKPKFFITVPFPYTNSPFHIGHGRTYITADIYARYMRMKGYNVLFPFAFQFTGTPILSVSEAIKRGDNDIIQSFIKTYGLSEEKVKEFEDPLKLAEYFKQEMENTAKKIGLSVDWRRTFDTMDKRFASFIQWQFKKLKDKGKLVVESNPVGYCPIDNFPVGMHDTKGDVEPEIGELDVIIFDGEEGYLYPMATSRPETVFAGVGIGVNDNAEYVIAEYFDKKYVLSYDAFRKLSYQRELKELKRISANELIGKTAINPITGKKVKIIKSKYVDPSYGTGLVMLTPAHDPFHKIVAEKEGLQEIYPVISTPGYPKIPTEVVETEDPAELKDYAESLYREEYYKGKILDVSRLVPDFMKEFVKNKIEGKPVKEARDYVIELLKTIGRYDKIYEINNGPIYCRCGAEIVVKVVKDQWFIKYDDPEWKMQALKSLDKINIIPPEARKEFEKVIFQLKRRAVGRSRGLGVKLPWDESQIIDSLSDSTIYTAFYTISHLINNSNDELFDYIFFGLGNAEELSKKLNITTEEIQKMRNEFTYWYPVDVRSSGRDLVLNHLPYYIYNHIAIFDTVPRSIVVNGFMRVGGKKMSKSFGNIYPLDKAIEEFGVDPIRLGLTIMSKLYEDIEFDPNSINAISQQLNKISSMINEITNFKGNNFGIAEKWLSTIIKRNIENFDKFMKEFDYNSAYKIALYDIYNNIKEYMSLTNSPNGELLRKVASAWLRLLYPAVPHFAEENWKFEGLVATSKFPDNEFEEYEDSIKIEYLENIIERARELQKISKAETAEKIIIYVNPNIDFAKEAAKAIENKETLKEFTSRNKTPNAEKMYTVMKEYSDYFRKTILKESEFDEMKILADFSQYIISELDILQMAVYDSTDNSIPDIKGKKSQALPLYPAIVLI
ncbi:leucine--tRNA ligase [Acidianus manzaensis]|uniref:Leucine--tRNA ligase n=1 Tax=Acidianus manzaensis TaxID=282676 RepID=A0A1W6JWZ0_9CREN|nr:leucine--tRNA ligase [Acidianus manzaensis]ARM74811.1 leucine--tRNA ligase [Acidianus manzaensis]